ncbi:hypothetical protein BDN72DRAFT_842455 [Pluteus cervinus]|uniref:Uncharacterized protein n=1 Tax=Pluteus cervinus TaxID=181527 RepID=A0ACD3AQL5_9AGAR|nr:hypothetical protein BDN72DRAFT_842455 [Pluteus cervinus]
MPLASIHHILTQRFDTRNIAFKTIDTEISSLEESIHALLAFRNTFTPAYSLPPEILTRIFHLAQQDQQDYIRSGGPPFKWLVMTQVSKRWRNIALDSPNLWSSISALYSKRIIKEWLKRSKEAPLDVTVSDQLLQSGDSISTSFPRIRTLLLNVTSQNWNSFWCNLSSPAPLLESLNIYISTYSQPHPTISDSTFAGTTPRLQRLKLHGCSIDVDSSIVNDLTSLELHYPSRKITATDLLTVIRKSPRLVLLALSNVLQSDDAVASTDFGVITLPSLKSLSIAGESLTHDLDILSHLSFPSNTTLRLNSKTQTEHAIPALSNFLTVHKAARRLGDFSPAAMFSVSLHYKWNLFDVSIKHKDPKIGDVKLVAFRLIGDWDDSIDKLTDNARTVALFSTLPLSSIVSFKTSIGITASGWINIFGSLPKLKKIFAIGDTGVNLLSAIADDFQTRSQPRSESRLVDWDPIFPVLEDIMLSDMVFPKDTAGIVGALRGRKEVGKGIRTLSFRYVRNVNEGILQGCVGRILWHRDDEDDKWD